MKDDTLSDLNSREVNLIIVLVVTNLINLIVYFLAERAVVGSLYTKFSFYRKIYNKYMLSDAVEKIKSISAILRKFKLLSK